MKQCLRLSLIIVMITIIVIIIGTVTECRHCHSVPFLRGLSSWRWL